MGLAGFICRSGLGLFHISDCRTNKYSEHAPLTIMSGTQEAKSNYITVFNKVFAHVTFASILLVKASLMAKLNSKGERKYTLPTLERAMVKGMNGYFFNREGEKIESVISISQLPIKVTSFPNMFSRTTGKSM